MNENKWKEAMNAKYGEPGISIYLNTSYPGKRYYRYTDSDGSLITIRRMKQVERRDGAAQVNAERLGLGFPKARIRIDQNEDPDLCGYAYRDWLEITTTIVVERDYYVALITYDEDEFSVSRFAEKVEKVGISIVEVMKVDVEEG